ncbi:hypothetical protein DPMN_188395 [Dreissena polymorpha]|uniref:Secreted protein n=1 Tax=Dreissena polymorpha TaxID=45954 RepID=A0A9D4I8G5_DREPO|nr:hypothetical protein DPMN_188395 [Dreissena polymorpha]
MASLLRLHCFLTASFSNLLRLWRSYCDPSASLGKYYRRCEDAQNAINQDAAQNAINQDAGVTGRRKTAFYRKSHWRPYYDNQKFPETQS